MRKKDFFNRCRSNWWNSCPFNWHKRTSDEVVLFDVANGIAKGKALDIAQSSQ